MLSGIWIDGMIIHENDKFTSMLKKQKGILNILNLQILYSF